jgi:kynurenine formamidase
MLLHLKILVINLRDRTGIGIGERERIGWDELKEWEGEMKEGVAVLLYTGWSEHWCTPKYYNHPFLDRGAAERIMGTGVRVIGVDTLSPDETHEDHENDFGLADFGVHEVVLGAGGVIVENLSNLGEVAMGRGRGFVGSFVPLSIGGCDGSPIRAFAWKED